MSNVQGSTLNFVTNLLYKVCDTRRAPTFAMARYTATGSRSRKPSRPKTPTLGSPAEGSAMLLCRKSILLIPSKKTVGSR